LRINALERVDPALAPSGDVGARLFGRPHGFF
jgi:hypothetical protein